MDRKRKAEIYLGWYITPAIIYMLLDYEAAIISVLIFGFSAIEVNLIKIGKKIKDKNELDKR